MKDSEKFKRGKSTYYTPDDKGYFKLMREAEDGKTKKGKHTRFWREKKNILKVVLKKIMYS